MSSFTFVYVLPWLLGAALFVAAGVRDRRARKGHVERGVRKPLEMRWLSAAIFAGGSLFGTLLGARAGSDFVVAWAVFHMLSSLVVFIALTKFLGRSPGVRASVVLSALSAGVSFFLLRGLVELTAATGLQ